MLRPLVGIRFQGLLSLPSRGFFSSFGRPTSPLSVVEEYLALRDGPRSFSRGSTCPDLLRYLRAVSQLSLTGLSPSVVHLSRMVQLAVHITHVEALQPRRENPHGLGCSPFARRYLGNRVFFLFLRLLRCFSSPGIASHAYGFSV